MDIALALGGGGAKGVAHIGVLEVLEREGFKIKALAGTSAGGVVGALYLAGITPEQMKVEFKHIGMAEMYGRLRGDEPSLLGIAGMFKILNRLLGNLTFEDLPVPFATTAVDIETGELIIFSEGKLIDAILATSAVPGMFPARRWNGRLLVDGGVTCPVPIAPVRELRPDLPLVAVALNQLSKAGKSFSIPETLHSNPVMAYISKLRLAQAVNIFLRSMEHSSVLLTELLLEVEKPDVAILPSLRDVGLLDEIDVVEIAERGEKAAEEKLDELRRVVKPSRRALRWVQKMIGAPGA